MPDINNVTQVVSGYTSGKDAFVLQSDIIGKIGSDFGLTQDQTSDFLSTAFSLVRAPKDLEGILLIKPALLVLLDEIFTAASSLSTEEKDLVVRLLDAWFEYIKMAPKGTLYDDRPTIAKSPFFAFYIEVSLLLGNQINKIFYKAFCILFCKTIQRTLSYRLDEATYEHYARAFRYFFTYMPEDIKSNEIHSAGYLEDYISEAIWNYDRKKKGNHSEKLNEAADGYAKLLKRLLITKTRSTPHNHGPCEKREFLENSEGVSEVTVPAVEAADGKIKILESKDDLTEETLVIRAASMPRSCFGTEGSTEETEADDDDDMVNTDFYYSTEVNPSDKVVPNIPSLSYTLADRLHLLHYIFYWDSKYPNLYHHAIIQRGIEESWSGASKKDKAKMVHILLMTHTGIAPEFLLHAGIVNEEIEEKHFEEFLVIIKRIHDKYYIFKPAPVQYKTEHESGDIFRSVSKIVRVPLSPFISRYIDESGLNTSTHGFFFSFKMPYKSTVINLDDLRKYLKPINKKNDFALTPHSISFSFFPLYHSRYGFDTIKACYISGQHLRQFSSQLHYVHFAASELETEYRQVSSVVEANIGKNISSLISQKKMQDYDKSPLMALTETNSSAVDEELVCGYGSPFVALTGRLISYVTALKEVISGLGWKDVIKRHNLYMVYAYLCMQYNFAYRPRNQVPFGFDSFTGNRYVVINDKLSSLYREERVLPVADTLTKLAGSVRKDFTSVKSYIARKINHEILQFNPDMFFFFFSQKGQYKTFSLKNLRACLSEAGLAYPFSMRTPRHFVRTYFYEKGFCNDLADALMGHHHTSKEPLGISSSLRYDDFTAQILPALNNMLEEICMTPVAYTPEEHDIR